KEEGCDLGLRTIVPCETMTTLGSSILTGETISGEWYTILLGSDVKKRIEENSVMRIFMEHIQGWDNSSLTFKFHVKIDGECIDISGLCDQAAEDGVYNVIYAGFDTFRIVEVVYSDYIIFHLISFNNEQTFQMMALFAREPDVSPKLKKKFVEICQKYGITEENIVDLTKVGKFSSLRFSLPKFPRYCREKSKKR
uniref:Lipocalin/cytosolic fatty-acid binding domain-containing protein n=1 Tax=Rhinolophus ferrumequinum TaxID=59479 RepID=A0A671EWY8_RHIFE